MKCLKMPNGFFIEWTIKKKWWMVFLRMSGKYQKSWMIFLWMDTFLNFIERIFHEWSNNPKIMNEFPNDWVLEIYRQIFTGILHWIKYSKCEAPRYIKSLKEDKPSKTLSIIIFSMQDTDSNKNKKVRYAGFRDASWRTPHYCSLSY